MCLDKDAIYLDPSLSLARLSVIVGTNTTLFLVKVFKWLIMRLK